MVILWVRQMSKKILLIEDEEDFARVVASYLKRKGFVVTQVTSGQGSLGELKKKSYELVILDLGLPDVDGLKLCQKIREEEVAPILILTARDEIEDRVVGLDAGADDYLVKPVSLKELVARINRLLNRNKNLKPGFRSSVFQFGEIEFDTVRGILNSNGKSVALTKKEKGVLEYLMLRGGRVLTRMEIMDHVWGEEINPFSNTVNMVISSLRRKLGRLSSNRLIHSVHGLGYKFELQRKETSNERKKSS